MVAAAATRHCCCTVLLRSLQGGPQEAVNPKHPAAAPAVRSCSRSRGGRRYCRGAAAALAVRLAVHVRQPRQAYAMYRIHKTLLCLC